MSSALAVLPPYHTGLKIRCRRQPPPTITSLCWTIGREVGDCRSGKNRTGICPAEERSHDHEAAVARDPVRRDARLSPSLVAALRAATARAPGAPLADPGALVVHRERVEPAETRGPDPACAGRGGSGGSGGTVGPGGSSGTGGAAGNGSGGQGGSGWIGRQGGSGGIGGAGGSASGGRRRGRRGGRGGRRRRGRSRRSGGARRGGARRQRHRWRRQPGNLHRIATRRHQRDGQRTSQGHRRDERRARDQ